MARSKDSLSDDQVRRYGRSGIQAENTTNIAHTLTNQRHADVTLPDGRSAGACADTYSEAVAKAEEKAVSQRRP